MLHRTSKQELFQLLELDLTATTPAQIRHHLTKVIRAGLLTPPVFRQGVDRYGEGLGQTLSRSNRDTVEAVGHEPQPRQRTKLRRHTDPIRR